MRDSTQNQLRFPAIAGFTVRADFEGGALSSDFGPLLLRGVEQQCGLIGRLAGAIHDGRHPSYIEHSVVDLLCQRIYQSACGYVDGNDANSLRRDPVFKLALGPAPLDEATALAAGPTFSRLWRTASAAKTSTGVETAEQIVKYLLAGADVVMTTSALLRHGPDHVRTLLDDLGAWLAARDLESPGQIRGSMSWSRLGETGAYERGNYIELIEAYSLAHR